jgi:hypothetical protein
VNVVTNTIAILVMNRSYFEQVPTTFFTLEDAMKTFIPKTFDVSHDAKDIKQACIIGLKKNTLINQRVIGIQRPKVYIVGEVHLQQQRVHSLEGGRERHSRA